MNQLTIFTLMFAFTRMIESQTTYDCDRNATCGCSKQPVIITRMFGGENSMNYSWGWAAIVNWKNGTYCTGTLISDSWVVVRAASMRYATLPIRVFVGATDYWNRQQVRNVSHIIRHPGFNNKTSENDIALLRVSPPFDLSDPSISIICLPVEVDKDFPALDTEMVAIGWGPETMNGIPSEFLQQANVKRVTASYPGCMDLIVRLSTQFCSMGIDKNITFYPADSGGAVMKFSTSRQWLFAGIIIGTGRNTTQEAVSVHTRVFSFVNWIKSTMAMDFPEENITDTTTVITLAPTDQTIATTTEIPPVKNDAKRLLTQQFSDVLVTLLLTSFSFLFTLS